MNRRNVLVEIIGSLLILLFVYTALSKLLEFPRFKLQLSSSPIVSNAALLTAILLPLSELIVATLLFIPRTRLAGLYGSLGLMTAFTLYITYILTLSDKVPCTCGGVIKQMGWNEHLVFNIFFTLLSLLGVILERRRRKQKKDPELPPVVFT